MAWIYNDGGRKIAGFKGDASDCVTRAIAIATGKPYREIYDDLKRLCKQEPAGKRRNGISHPRKGIHRITYDGYIKSLGFVWHPVMKIGSGCTMHVNESELPKGHIILRMAKHLVCAINGDIHDTFDCSKNGTACVYGYWK